MARVYYIISTVSAALQTTLWGGSELKFEPGMGGEKARTLTTIDHHTSLIFIIMFCTYDLQDENKETVLRLICYNSGANV